MKILWIATYFTILIWSAIDPAGRRIREDTGIFSGRLFLADGWPVHG